MEAVEVIHQRPRFERSPRAARQTVAGEASDADEQVRPDGDLQRKFGRRIGQRRPADGYRVRLSLQEGIDGLGDRWRIEVANEQPAEQPLEVSSRLDQTSSLMAFNWVMTRSSGVLARNFCR